MKKIIFTDLDGTFLNHDDYKYEESKEALEIIRESNITIVFTTSKTKAEVELLQKELNIREPFIVENGAALFIPKQYKNFDFSFLPSFDEKYYYLKLGLSYDEILKFFNLIKKEFFIEGFSSLTIDTLCSLTNLKKEQILLSKQRDFTEPFILENEKDLQKIQKEASKYNIKITKGGRFFHMIGKNQDKGLAVKKCIEIFEKVEEKKLYSIALGDGKNDIPMFENVDLAIIIKNHLGLYVQTDLKNSLKSTYKGSKGFKEMILKCLKKH